MKKLTFKQYFWIFIICSFLGVIMEMIYWYLKKGVIESRRGLIYGPFNMVYGLGALILTICLDKENLKSRLKIFIISFILGTLFEYCCSYFQEIAFGTVSWEYSKKFLNINGRVSFVYSFFWGILGLVWIKFGLPLILHIIKYIPFINPLTLIMIIFMSYNCFISFCATKRQNDRYNHIEARNKFELYLDNQYSDSLMKKIFPNAKRKT